ncbi:hypothetical protein RYZ26_10695 [Terasakiella sp. A23]|uniref:hypothetical protein n=1 Tax=Terasakiella sp. FCG-A23 TaxID=3080561 RepID=UPI002954775C|nr:hypothetical protein [Terasakiella sp. A23]MDV7340062.1 hypothetical protein [Terasakiella sp. A23]
MSLFPDFSNMFRVGKTISQDANADPNDVLNTKNALAQTGDYQVPDFGITDVPDMGMIDGLKSFQQKNGLKVDGVMKPGGPTESKMADVLATQGGDGVDPQSPKKPINPKPGKIDPLTGLPEVKMPKPKTPGKGLWEPVGQAPKPVTTPWFQSPKVQPLPDEDHSANTRALDGMLQYTKNGSLPALFADSLKTGDEKAVNEFANFMQQLNARKPERAAAFEQEVMSKLPEQGKQSIQAYAQQQDGDVSQASDDDYQDSEKCMELKSQYDEDIQRSNDAWNDYLDKQDELDGVSQDAKDALDNLRDILTEVLFGIVLRGVRKGNVRGAIDQAKKPVNWLDVFDNAWTLYEAKGKEEELQKEAKKYKEDSEFWKKESEKTLLIAGKNYHCKIHSWKKS